MSRYPATVAQAVVTRVQRLSPSFVRVSLAGPDLAELAAPAGDGRGPVLDAYLKLLIPHPSRREPVTLDLDGGWRDDWFSASAEERGGWLRTYTLRAARPWPGAAATGAAGVEIDIDFVLHGAAPGVELSSLEEAMDAGMGPGSAWAASVRPGDRVSFLGPSREGQLWTSWNPGAARRVIVAVDETAVPAAGSVLTALPEGARATFLLEIPARDEAVANHLSDELALARRTADVELRMLPRSADAEQGSALLPALRDALGLSGGGATASLGEPVGEDEIVWETAPATGETYAYLAGEATMVRALRRACVDVAGIDKADVAFMGYWKRGRAEN